LSSRIASLSLSSLTLILVLALQVSAVPGASPSPDFSITASPSSLTVPVTGSGLVQVTLTSLNSFSGQVNLTASSQPTSDPTLILGAPSLVLPARGTASTWLNITIYSPVDYTVTVVGTSGVLTHSANINVPWGPPETDFMVTTNREQLITLRSLSDTAQITVTSLHLFAGTISMTGAVTPAIANAPTISYSPSSFPVSNWGSGSTSLIVQTTSMTPLQNFTILVSATGQTYAGLTTHSITLNLIVVNSGFEISANPSTFDTGTTDSDGTVIRVVSINGFAGNVTLTASVGPKAPGVYIPVTVRMFPDNLRLRPNAEQDSLLIATVSGSIATSYDVTVVVNDGALVRSLVLTFQVDTAQYRSYRTIDWLSATTGTTNSLLINVLNQTSYPGPVSLTDKIFPSIPNGPVISFQPSSLSLTSLGWNTADMVVTTTSNTPLGVYILFLTESSGTMKLSPVAVILTVEDPIQFSLTVSPASFVVQAGFGVANAQLSISNLSNSPGQVTVATSYNTTALSVVLWRNPSLYYIERDPLDISSNSTTTLSLAVTSSHNAATGNYTILITGTSGNITHSTFLRISVFDFNTDFLEAVLFQVGDAYPGSSPQLIYNFSDIGQLAMSVLGVQLQAFNRTYFPISSPVALTGGENKTVTTTLQIPNTVRPGLQRLYFYILWEFYNPVTSQWVTANPLQFSGNLTIVTPPVSPPPTTPTPGPTGPFPSITGFMRTLQSFVFRLANGQSMMPLPNGSSQEVILVTAVASYACLAALAGLLFARQKRRTKTRTRV
jgi:hypothetical protein